MEARCIGFLFRLDGTHPATRSIGSANFRYSETPQGFGTISAWTHNYNGEQSLIVAAQALLALPLLRQASGQTSRQLTALQTFVPARHHLSRRRSDVGLLRNCGKPSVQAM